MEGNKTPKSHGMDDVMTNESGTVDDIDIKASQKDIDGTSKRRENDSSSKSAMKRASNKSFTRGPDSLPGLFSTSNNAGKLIQCPQC